MVARRKTWHPPRPPKRKGIRPGMLVICPWCERSGVHVTKKGLIEHPGSDLDTGAPPCVGSGQRVAIGAFGRIVKETEAGDGTDVAKSSEQGERAGQDAQRGSDH
jgi:hypothetical protein